MDQEELQVHRGARPGHFGQAFSKKEILYIVTLYTRALTFENLWQAGFTRIWQKLKPGREATAAHQRADCECRRMQVCVCRERERESARAREREREREGERKRERNTHTHTHTHSRSGQFSKRTLYSGFIWQMILGHWLLRILFLGVDNNGIYNCWHNVSDQVLEQHISNTLATPIVSGSKRQDDDDISNTLATH
jgi:hypothetical protein